MRRIFLNVDVGSYLVALRREHLREQRGYPEINPNLSVGERKRKADEWFASRTTQLTSDETEALRLLRHARSCGFLDAVGLEDAVDDVRKLYDELRALSKKEISGMYITPNS